MTAAHGLVGSDILNHPGMMRRDPAWAQPRCHRPHAAQGTRALPLADNLFLILHNRRSGRCHLKHVVVGLGLAGALLGELVLTGTITINGCTVEVRTDRAPRDRLASQVHQALRQAGEEPWVSDCLHALGSTAPDSVAERLVEAGHLRARSRLLSARPRYLPVEVATTMWPATQLVADPSGRYPASTEDTVLAGLLLAIGQSRTRLRATHHKDLDRRLDHLPEPLRLLVTHTEEAVGDALYRQHRCPRTLTSEPVSRAAL